MVEQVRRIRKFFLVCFVCCFSMLVLGASGDSQTSQAVPKAIRELTEEEKITPEELRALQLKRADFVLFDARDNQVYDQERITGARLPLPIAYYQDRQLFRARVISRPPDLDATLAESTKRYPKNTNIVVYCNRDCKAGAFLLLQLKKLGFTRVRAMEAGIGEWKEKGYPVTAGAPKVSGL